MDTVTTTIKRQWLKDIVDKTKRVEYRQIKPYWDKRLSAITPPFRLRLINGMQYHAPEATVIIERIRKNIGSAQYELHIGKIIEILYWNARLGKPSRNKRQPDVLARRSEKRQTKRSPRTVA
jgi:hypothetical protein